MNSNTAANRLEAALLGLICLSLVFQPTNIRVGSVPLTILFVGIFLAFAFLTEPRIHPARMAALAGPFVILIAYDFMMRGEVRSAVHFTLLAFSAQLYSRRYPSSTLRAIWTMFALACTVLTTIGAHRYLTGYKAEASENMDGVVDILDTYVYFGISYLPSTRNSDALYFGLGAVVSFWLLTTASRAKSGLVYFAMFSANAAAAVLSLSRGVWLAFCIALIIAYRARAISKYALPVLLALGILVFFNLTTVGDLLLNGLLSLANPNAANLNVAGYYSYSNEARLFIYEQALRDFVWWPFGHGIAFSPSYSILTGVKSVHSENLYLDLLLILGVFAIPLLLGFYRKLTQAALFRSSSLYPLSRSIGVFLAIYALFNGGVDLVVLWLAIGMLFVTINSGSRSASLHHGTVVGTYPRV